MPEEQSVHARDGVADTQGCGNPLRSGMAGLSFAAASPPHPQESASSRPRTHRSEATPNPGEKGPPCPKSKASTPGMAWPIRRDAVILCGRAWRAFRLQRPEATPHPAEKSLSIAAASPPHPSAAERPLQKKRQAGFPLTCRFCNEPQLMPDNLLVVFSRVVFVFRFRCNLFIVRIRFRRDIILAFRHAAVD